MEDCEIQVCVCSSVHMCEVVRGVITSIFYSCLFECKSALCTSELFSMAYESSENQDQAYSPICFVHFCHKYTRQTAIRLDLFCHRGR